MKQPNRTGIARQVAGVAALAVFAVACSGSSDGAESEVTTPVSEAPTVPITEPPATLAPVVTEPPATEPTVDEAAIPDLPCAEYVDESGYPLKPCDKGVLVETLQRDLVSLFPGIAIDGLFGSQTFGFVQEFQASNGLEETGLVSEELARQIAEAEALGDDSGASDDAEEPEATTASAGAVTTEFCNDLIGEADDPNFTAETIEDCSDLGVDIVGES